MSDDFDILRKEIERLTAKIDRVDARLDRAAALFSEYDALLQKHCMLLSRDLKDAFDRIINLELTVFPNLQQDIDHVYKVIGEGDDKADNPLDRRKP